MALSCCEKLSALLRGIKSFIYAVLEYLLEKLSISHNNPETSSKTKNYEYTHSGYSMFTHSSFDTTKKKLDYYRGKDCIGKIL